MTPKRELRLRIRRAGVASGLKKHHAAKKKALTTLRRWLSEDDLLLSFADEQAVLKLMAKAFGLGARTGYRTGYKRAWNRYRIVNEPTRSQAAA